MVSKCPGRHYPARPRDGANPGRTQERARSFAVAGRHDLTPLRPWLIGGFLMLVLLAGAGTAPARGAGAGSGFAEQAGAGADADSQRSPRHEHLHAVAVPDDLQ